MPRMFRILPILLILLSAMAAMPARAADEAQQVLMLKKLFMAPTPQWEEMLRQHRNLLDGSFFERVEKRIRWSLDNGQVDDAVRFVIVGDLAGRVAGRKTSYRLDLAQLFLKLNNVPMVIDLLDNILVMEPKNQPARFLKASVLHDGGNLVDSYNYYSELASEGYRKAECLYRMALIELRKEDPGLARKHLEEAVRIDPRHVLARQELDRVVKGLAELHFVPEGPGGQPNNVPFQGTPNQGGPNSLTPDQKNRADDFLAQAESARDSGDLPRAVDLYRQAISANPTLVKAYVYLGSVYFQTRNLDTAINTLTRASELDPKDAEAWRFLGYCYERRWDVKQESGDLQRAMEAFQKSNDLDPTNELLRMDLQRVQDKAKALVSAAR